MLCVSDLVWRSVNYPDHVCAYLMRGRRCLCQPLPLVDSVQSHIRDGESHVLGGGSGGHFDGFGGNRRNGPFFQWGQAQNGYYLLSSPKLLATAASGVT